MTLVQRTGDSAMKLRLLCSLIVLGVCAANVWAQNQFVYTNNDPLPNALPNSVTGFSMDESGVLTQVPGSPFLTGGLGGGGGFFASSRVVRVGNFLYASNSVSNDVSGFSIDPDTGNLTPLPDSPFPTGGVTGDGFSLAATPDGQFLYAAQDYSATIRTFGIDPGDGHLTPVGDLLPVGADISANGLKVSPDGRWLALSLTRVLPHGQVAMFSIDAETGAPTPVPGSPFPVRDPGGTEGRAAGVDINCASDTLFVAEATIGTTIVDVLRIDPDSGALAPIEGSPFTPGVGANSNVALLSPDDSLLFVSNQGSNSVTVLSVASDGSLTLVSGSPFDAGGGNVPSGMATDPTGAFLYVTKVNHPGVDVFSVDSSGELTAVPGSPFLTGLPDHSALLSLTAVPGKTCPAKSK